MYEQGSMVIVVKIRCCFFASQRLHRYRYKVDFVLADDDDEGDHAD